MGIGCRGGGRKGGAWRQRGGSGREGGAWRRRGGWSDGERRDGRIEGGRGREGLVSAGGRETVREAGRGRGEVPFVIPSNYKSLSLLASL